VAQVETGDALRQPLAQLPHRADQEEWVVRRIVRGEPVAGRDHGPEALGLRRRLGELHEEHGREGEGRRIPPRRPLRRSGGLVDPSGRWGVGGAGAKGDYPLPSN
jgi:hypothetical protein